MQKLLKALCAAFCLITLPVCVHASCDILVDGVQISAVNSNGVVVEPFIESGTTYVPVRAIATSFNVEVSWDQETQTVYIGTKSGSPILNSYTNIFYNGTEFTAKDALGNIVRPILKEGTTYLPVRAIGELFGKTVSWDGIANTVSLSTPCNDEAKNYFLSSLSNTEKLDGLKANVTFSGTLSHDGALISQVSEQGEEEYKNTGFYLSSFLPADYSISYLGSGKYFIIAPQDAFASSAYVQIMLEKRGFNSIFSNIYISVETKGGYITNVEVLSHGSSTFESVLFSSEFDISASLVYPEGFTFPILPPPVKTETVTDSAEEKVEQNTSVSGSAEASESLLVSAEAKKFIDALLAPNAREAALLMSSKDYNDLFSSRSPSQLNVDFTAMNKKIEKKYENYNGSYTVDSMVYLSSPNQGSQSSVRLSVSIVLGEGDMSHVDELVFELDKVDGAWHVNKNSFQAIMQ